MLLGFRTTLMKGFESLKMLTCVFEHLESEGAKKQYLLRKLPLKFLTMYITHQIKFDI